MKKQDIQDLVMGAAVVAVGFILYKQFKAPASAWSGSGTVGGVMVGGQVGGYYDPTLGAPYNPETVAGRMGLADLWNGISNTDWLGGGTDYLATISSPLLGGKQPDSIVKPGWWN